MRDEGFDVLLPVDFCHLGADSSSRWKQLLSQRINTFGYESDLGVIWIRPDDKKRKLRVVVDQLAT